MGVLVLVVLVTGIKQSQLLVLRLSLEFDKKISPVGNCQSPTIPRMVKQQLTNLGPGDICQEWSPTISRMVTCQPNDGHPPEGPGIWHLDLTNKTKTR